MSARRLFAALACALALFMAPAGGALAKQAVPKPPGLDMSLWGLIKDAVTGGYYFNRMITRMKKANKALDYFFKLSNAASHLSNSIAYWPGPDPINWIDGKQPPYPWYDPLVGAPRKPRGGYDGSVHKYPFAWRQENDDLGIRARFCDNTLVVWLHGLDKMIPRFNLDTDLKTLPLGLKPMDIVDANYAPAIFGLDRMVNEPDGYPRLDVIQKPKDYPRPRVWIGNLKRMVDLPSCLNDDFSVDLPVGVVAKVIHVKDRAATVHDVDVDERRTLPCPKGTHGLGRFQRRTVVHQVDLLGHDHTQDAIKEAMFLDKFLSDDFKKATMATVKADPFLYETWKAFPENNVPAPDEGWETTADTCVEDKTFDIEHPSSTTVPEPKKTEVASTETDTKAFPCPPGSISGLRIKHRTRPRTDVTVTYPWAPDHPVKSVVYGAWSPWRTTSDTCRRPPPKPHPVYSRPPARSTIYKSGGKMGILQFDACIHGHCPDPRTTIPYYSQSDGVVISPPPCPNGYHHDGWRVDRTYTIKPGSCGYWSTKTMRIERIRAGHEEALFSRICRPGGHGGGPPAPRPHYLPCPGKAWPIP